MMARHPKLPNHIREALSSIEPSNGGSLMYFPCEVVLKDGTVLDNVYIEPEGNYIRWWGVWPEADPGKRWVWIDDVKFVKKSRNRLPVRFANELYRSGESGMGYTIFTVVFSDGSRQVFGTGNAVDFIEYPPGKTQADVIAVLPHEGRTDLQLKNAPDYFWCLYSE
jgi:hypothetical protein